MDHFTAALARGVVSASSLRDALAVSPSTLMRMVRAADADIIRIGHGRATRYGWRRVWPRLAETRFPLFRIDETGAPESAGTVVTLAARQTVWLPDGRVTHGLPVELFDIRPAGFLGRHFAATHADLALPARLEDWSDEHILLALSRRGEDLPGNLMVGDESFARWQALAPSTVSSDDYAALAEATLAGHPPGSSAAGERPKFAVLSEGRHVLVKFAAGAAVADAASRRWHDLLCLEALALAIVEARGIPSARTRLIETDTHVFLESERFDRAGVRGRLAVLSLAALHDNLADSWGRAAGMLVEAGTLTAHDGWRLRWLDAFGALIGNTDRHPHNVAFLIAGGEARLAPVFDQAAMLYAPTANGQIPERHFAVPAITAETLEMWDNARAAAREFWARAADDRRISDSLRAVSAANARLLAAQ